MTFTRAGWLESSTPEQRSELAARLRAYPPGAGVFKNEVIKEIVRRLETMTPETFVEAACDILKQSRIEPDAAEEV